MFTIAADLSWRGIDKLFPNCPSNHQSHKTTKSRSCPRFKRKQWRGKITKENLVITVPIGNRRESFTSFFSPPYYIISLSGLNEHKNSKRPHTHTQIYLSIVRSLSFWSQTPWRFGDPSRSLPSFSRSSSMALSASTSPASLHRTSRRFAPSSFPFPFPFHANVFS